MEHFLTKSFIKRYGSVLFFYYLFLTSCSVQSQKENLTTSNNCSHQVINEEKIRTNDSIVDTKDSIYQVDTSGNKQGRWIRLNTRNQVIKIETYLNDTLNGYWFEWDGMQIDGYYRNGKKDGFFRVYYGDKSKNKVMSISKYDSDSLLWTAFPAANENSAIPIKRMLINKDSMYVKIPYNQNSIWYKGLFINKKAVGEHFIYNRAEQLIATVDYNDNIIWFTEKASPSFIADTKVISSNWNYKY